MKTDELDGLEDNAPSADDALPARIARLTPAEQLGEAVVALGPKAVRPILEDGHGLCEAAAERRDDGPWWRLLSEVLDELCRHDIDEGWRLLCSTIEATEQVLSLEALERVADDAPLELDDRVCTVDSILLRQDSPLGRHFANLSDSRDS